MLNAPWVPGASGVLCAYALNSAFNAFLFMVYASATGVSAKRFHVPPDKIAFLYSISLYISSVTSVFWIFMIRRLAWAAQVVAVGSNGAAVAFFYAASVTESYQLAVASAIMTGFAAGVCVPTPAFLGDAWFCADDRTQAVSLMIEANVIGWWLGSVLVPVLVEKPDDLVKLSSSLALPATVNAGLFATCWKSAPESAAVPPRITRPPRLDDLGSLLAAVLAFTLLGGLGFALPGVQDTLFARPVVEGGYGIPEVYTSITNTSFLLSGVFTGLALGQLPTSRPRLPDMQTLGGVCFLGLLGLVYLRRAALTGGAQIIFAALGMAIVGGPTLGYLPIAIDVISAFGISAEIAGGGLLFMTNLGGAVLSEFGSEANGMDLCATIAVLAVVLLAVVRIPAGSEAVQLKGVADAHARELPSYCLVGVSEKTEPRSAKPAVTTPSFLTRPLQGVFRKNS